MPLHWASLNDNEDAFDYVASHYDSIDLEDNKGRTPLMQACWNSNNHAFWSLVRHGANIDAISRLPSSPLSVAVRSGNLPILDFLIENGANIPPFILHLAVKGTPRILQYLLDKCSLDIT